jgi:hypothetical protein
VLRLSELLKKKYRKLIDEQWRVVRVQAVASIEEEWECFNDAIRRTLEEVCGLRTVGAGGKESEWWSEEAVLVVRETFPIQYFFNLPAHYPYSYAN